MMTGSRWPVKVLSLNFFGGHVQESERERERARERERLRGSERERERVAERHSIQSSVPNLARQLGLDETHLDSMS